MHRAISGIVIVGTMFRVTDNTILVEEVYSVPGRGTVMHGTVTGVIKQGDKIYCGEDMGHFGVVKGIEFACATGGQPANNKVSLIVSVEYTEAKILEGCIWSVFFEEIAYKPIAFWCPICFNVVPEEAMKDHSFRHYEKGEI